MKVVFQFLHFNSGGVPIMEVLLTNTLFNTNTRSMDHGTYVL
jgi:hypothetical protein